jgi:hypothetical protein
MKIPWPASPEASPLNFGEVHAQGRTPEMVIQIDVHRLVRHRMRPSISP